MHEVPSFEPTAVPYLPLDAKLPMSTEAVIGIFEQQIISGKNFSDGRIDNNAVIQSVAEHSALRCGDTHVPDEDAEAFMDGSRVAFTFVKAVRMFGVPILDVKAPGSLNTPEEYLDNLSSEVGRYRKYSQASRILVEESQKRAERGTSHPVMFSLGMYTVFYFANAGEITKDKLDYGDPEQLRTQKILAGIERQYRSELLAQRTADSEVIRTLEEQFKEIEP